MEITHELLEGMLKKLVDKMKFNLCLKFENDAYSVVLSDGLIPDAAILNGDTVIIKIRTALFVSAVTKRGLGEQFRQLLEQCLLQVPRMRLTLTHQPRADVVMFDEETRKFKKVTQAEYDKLHPKHTYEKDIHYSTDVRTTAIHWKAGVVVRETGATLDTSRAAARRKILSVLNDTEIYTRTGDDFYVVDSKDDLIYDMVISASVLNKEEMKQLIERLTKEYL